MTSAIPMQYSTNWKLVIKLVRNKHVSGEWTTVVYEYHSFEIKCGLINEDKNDLRRTG